MKITPRIAMEIASHEACVPQAYLDVGGVWTWGFGLTDATGHRVERYKNNPQTLQRCVDIYVWALRNYAEQVREAFRGHDLTEAQFGAALSFHWNTGGLNVRRKGGIARWAALWMEGKAKESYDLFTTSWITPRALLARRIKERDLFFDNKWSNDGTTLLIPGVTASFQPNFRTSRRVDVRQEMKVALALTAEAVLDVVPAPDNEPVSPTLTPDPKEVPTVPESPLPKIPATRARSTIALIVTVLASILAIFNVNLLEIVGVDNQDAIVDAVEPLIALLGGLWLWWERRKPNYQISLSGKDERSLKDRSKTLLSAWWIGAFLLTTLGLAACGQTITTGLYIKDAAIDGYCREVNLETRTAIRAQLATTRAGNTVLIECAEAQPQEAVATGMPATN